MQGMFKDNAGNTSSFRVLGFIAVAGGLAVMLADAFGLSECGHDYNTTLAFLFGGVFGGKAVQKKFET